MEHSKTRNHRARHKTRASLLSDKGLDAANHNRASGGGSRMFLTSPLIEQAITLTTPINEYMTISRQLLVTHAKWGRHDMQDRSRSSSIPGQQKTLQHAKCARASS